MIPAYIRSDNGSEFIEKQLRRWLGLQNVKTLYIEPGSPWQNAYIESFHARFRQECLDREQLWTLTKAQVVAEDWRWKYNHFRPHRSLGYIIPIQSAQKETDSIDIEGSGFGRLSAFLRPNLDFLYNLKHELENYQANSIRGPVWVT